MAPFGRLERVEEIVLVGAGDSGQRVEGERPADDRRGRQHLAVLGAELVQASSEDQPDALRDLGVADLESGPPVSMFVHDAAAVAEVAEKFLGEERVPLRFGVDEVDEFGRSVAAGAGGQQCSDFLLAEEPGAEVDRADVAEQRADGSGQRSSGFQLVVAVRADDKHRKARRPGADVAQEQQRRLVGPVEILVGEHHWLVVCGAFDELADPVKHVATFLLRGQIRRRGNVVVPLAKRRQQLGDLGRVDAERRPETLRRDGPCRLLEMVDRRLVGRR